MITYHLMSSLKMLQRFFLVERIWIRSLAVVWREFTSNLTVERLEISYSSIAKKLVRCYEWGNGNKKKIVDDSKCNNCNLHSLLRKNSDEPKIMQTENSSNERFYSCSTDFHWFHLNWLNFFKSVNDLKALLENWLWIKWKISKLIREKNTNQFIRMTVFFCFVNLKISSK